jgi:IMP dehydrogenase
MTPEPVLVPPSMTAEEAARTMLEKNFRHLPVISAEERVVGILSIRDVARWSVDSHQD